MKRNKQRKTQEEIKSSIIYAAAKSFLEKGYTASTLREIADSADVNIGSLTNIFPTKEEILCELVSFVLNKQFEVTHNIINGITEDKLLFYATETVLQLHIVEMSENLRDLYTSAYSLPKSSGIIQYALTGKLENIFKEQLPDLRTRDFYKLEIASGGIMRGFMTIPCDMWFTMDQKVDAFLGTTFLIYRVPTKKIKEAVDFVKQFDFDKIAQETIGSIIELLEEKLK